MILGLKGLSNVVLFIFVSLICLKDKMDAIMCATMATNLAELRHYYSNNHNLIRQNLVKNVWFKNLDFVHSVTGVIKKNVLIMLLPKTNSFAGWKQ